MRELSTKEIQFVSGGIEEVIVRATRLHHHTRRYFNFVGGVTTGTHSCFPTPTPFTGHNLVNGSNEPTGAEIEANMLKSGIYAGPFAGFGQIAAEATRFRNRNKFTWQR